MDINLVKNAIVYENINDNRPKRTIQEIIDIIKGTSPDFIFRSWWRWSPLPPNCNGFSGDLYLRCEDFRYTFEYIQADIAQVKQEFPNIIIVGAIPAQKINQTEINDLTGQSYSQTETWAMALDPAKWGISSPTKDEFQSGLSGGIGGGYFPDITNIDYQDILLSMAKRQIDAGMDAIWIDLLFTQAGQLTKMTNDINHLGVKESFEAASKIVNEIHSYGNSRGKTIYVGTWQVIGYPYAPPNLDFITITPTSTEVNTLTMNSIDQDTKINSIRSLYGNIPIFAFIDWSATGAPLDVFGKLTVTDKVSFLEIANAFYTERDVKFIFPVHGGLAVDGTNNWYDSEKYGILNNIKQMMTGYIQPSNSSNLLIIGTIVAGLIGVYYLLTRK